MLHVTCTRPGAIPGIFASVDRGRGMAWMRAHIRAHGGAVRMASLPANYVLTSTACVGFRRDRKPRLHRWGLDPPRFTDANGPPRSGSEFPHACPQFSHTPFRTSRAVPVLGCRHHGRTVRPVIRHRFFPFWTDPTHASRRSSPVPPVRSVPPLTRRDAAVLSVLLGPSLARLLRCRHPLRRHEARLPAVAGMRPIPDRQLASVNSPDTPAAPGKSPTGRSDMFGAPVATIAGSPDLPFALPWPPRCLACRATLTLPAEHCRLNTAG